ncbi:MAG: alternative ribosome rescue aminoacyl-tRNA hydrolase ArfB [Longimicrobiales bacterium]
MDEAVVISQALTVPRSELEYRATRSGGPGGQHVNTSSTRIELTWNVAASPSLSDDQRLRILEKLKNRIDEQGVLRLVASASRSQYRNREDVTERFARLVASALLKRKPRKRTKPPRQAKEARLKSKKQRSERKKLRGPIASDE